MERKLLLLGLLRMETMHGYQLNDVIDSHLGTAVQLKKATAYDLLRKMTDDGWITYQEERTGNRPTRRVYTVTAEGEAAFQQMLRDSLSSYQPAEFLSDISLAFLDLLPINEAVDLLRQRRSIVAELCQTVSAPEMEHKGSMQLVVEHQRRHLAAELDWIDDVIRQYTQGEKK